MATMTPREQTKTGDRVRWWPDGKDRDGCPYRNHYADGVVEGFSYGGCPLLRVAAASDLHGACGLAWRPGVLDTSVSPGAVDLLVAACGVGSTHHSHRCHACGARLMILHGEGLEPEIDRVAAHDEVCPRRKRGSKRRP